MRRERKSERTRVARVEDRERGCEWRDGEWRGEVHASIDTHTHVHRRRRDRYSHGCAENPRTHIEHRKKIEKKGIKIRRNPKKRRITCNSTITAKGVKR